MYDPEYIEKLKKYHLCVRCKKQDAYTLAGRSCCSECAEYARERYRLHSGENKEKKRKYNLAKRQECIKNNICSRCLKRKTDTKHKVCVVCRDALKNKRKAQKIYSIDDAICFRCKNPLDGQLKVNGDPSKFCSICYENVVKVTRDNNKGKKIIYSPFVTNANTMKKFKDMLAESREEYKKVIVFR